MSQHQQLEQTKVNRLTNKYSQTWNHLISRINILYVQVSHGHLKDLNSDFFDLYLVKRE